MAGRGRPQVKALTLHEPWATLIARGLKEVETRDWYTSYRGPLAIHAGLRKPSAIEVSRITFALGERGIEPPFDVKSFLRGAGPNFGAIVATCRLVACLPAPLGVRAPVWRLRSRTLGVDTSRCRCRRASCRRAWHAQAMGLGTGEPPACARSRGFAVNAIARPALRYFGGKWRLAPWLIRLFPSHHVYTEAFGGGASVLLQKPRSRGEIYNDLDGEVVNVFRVLQDPAKAKRLEALLRVTPFAREEFDLSYKKSRDDVERARRTIVRSFMGFGSDSITRVTTASKAMRTGFRATSWRTHTGAEKDWANYANHIRHFCLRLQGVVIENRDAMKVIESADREDTLHYVDPPYPHDVRKSKSNYRYEMTMEQHRKLADLLHSVKGMVLISSYPGPYDDLYRDWNWLSYSGTQFCHGAQERRERVWFNPAAQKRQGAMRLW